MATPLRITLCTSLLLASCSAYSLPAAIGRPMGAVRASSPAMILMEPDRTAKSPTTVRRTMDNFLEQFNGHFDNCAQVAANEAEGLTPRHGGGHEHIHCAVRPIELQSTSTSSSGGTTPVVLATYYFNGQPDLVFRERLYKFEPIANDAQFGSCVRMSIYKLRDEVATRLRSAGGAGGADVDEIAFTTADLADELHIPQADVYWRWLGERFEGAMREESLTIVSERSGREIVVRDDVALWTDALWVNDRGHDAETGEYVYGNIHNIPYKLARVPDDHWTSRADVEPPTASSE